MNLKEPELPEIPSERHYSHGGSPIAETPVSEAIDRPEKIT
jgi:hypothetical protein